MSEAQSARSASSRGRPETHRPIRIGMIGVGTVGTGAVRVFAGHQREVERRLGCRLELKTLCSRSIHRRDLSWLRRPVELTTDWREVVHDPEIDIVVELVGEIKTARAIARAALAAGKHVVTANKQLVAEHSTELVERAHRAGVGLGIEACVAAGTPILYAIREGLAGEHFSAVYGILNGTTNYILTEMERRGCDYGEVLAEAQQKGDAEPDPTFDVEGYDARYKIAILAMLCFGQAVSVKDIPAEGITRIEQVDFAYAHRLDRTIRLIAAARRHTGGHVEIFVRPMMIPRSAQLAAVAGAINGVLLAGDKGGNTMVTGPGAGGEQTGVAILSDIVQIARAIASGSAPSTPLGYMDWHPARAASSAGHEMAAYLRLVVRDRPGILARHRINIDSVLQEPAHSKRKLPFVMTLEPVKEQHITRAVAEITRLPFMAQPPLMLPFADL